MFNEKRELKDLSPLEKLNIFVNTKNIEDYPILKEYVDQDELIKFIDKQIDSMKSEIDKVITKSLE